MTRSKRMKPVQQVAQSREKTAGRQFGHSRQQLAAHEEKLQELIAYRQQYTASFQSSGSTGLNAHQMQDYRVFLSRLNDAIAQQEMLIVQCRQHSEQSRKHWVNSRTHSQAIGKVVERYQQDECKQRERQEQKDLDERSQHVAKHSKHE